MAMAPSASSPYFGVRIRKKSFVAEVRYRGRLPAVKFYHRTGDERKAAFYVDVVNFFLPRHYRSKNNFFWSRTILEKDGSRLRWQLDRLLANQSRIEKERLERLRNFFIDVADELWEEHEDSIVEGPVRPLHKESSKPSSGHFNHKNEGRVVGGCSFGKQTEELIDGNWGNIVNQESSSKFDVDVGLLYRAPTKESELKKQVLLPPKLGPNDPHEEIDAAGFTSGQNMETTVPVKENLPQNYRTLIDEHETLLEESFKFIKSECSQERVDSLLTPGIATTLCCCRASIDTSQIGWPPEMLIESALQIKCAQYLEVWDKVNEFFRSECPQKIIDFGKATEPLLKRCIAKRNLISM